MSVRIKQLKNVVIVTNKREQEVLSLYWMVKKNLYTWAEETQENIIEELKREGLQIVSIIEYNNMMAA